MKNAFAILISVIAIFSTAQAQPSATAQNHQLLAKLNTNPIVRAIYLQAKSGMGAVKCEGLSLETHADDSWVATASCATLEDPKSPVGGGVFEIFEIQGITIDGKYPVIEKINFNYAG